MCLICSVNPLVAQDWSWAWGAYSNNEELTTDIAVNDSLNQVWVIGQFDGPIPNLPGAPAPLLPGVENGLLIKLDTLGNLLDYTTIGSLSDMELNSIAVDDSGNVYVTGSYTGFTDFSGNGTNSVTLAATLLLEDVFVAKFNPNLEGQWAVRGGGSFNQVGKEIAVDGDRVFVSGDFQNGIQFGSLPVLNSNGSYDVFLTAIHRSSANPLWSVGMGENGGEFCRGLVAGGGSVYLTGIFNGDSMYVHGNPAGAVLNSDPGASDFFVLKMDSATQNSQWLIRGGGLEDDLSEGMDWRPGLVFLGGQFEQNASFGSTFVNSAGGFDAFSCGINDLNGQFLWVRPEGGPAEESIRDVAIRPGGDLYVAGAFDGLLVLSGGTVFNAGAAEDCFVTAYSPSGAPRPWAREATNNNNVFPTSLAAAGSGIYVGGDYESASVVFGPSVNLPGDLNDNLFVAQLGCAGANSPNLNATINADSICPGDSISILINASLAANNYQLVDLNGDTLGPVLPGQNGPLTLTSFPIDSSLTVGILVYPGGTPCDVLAQDTFDVWVSPLPSPDLGPDQNVCGDSVVLRPSGNWNGYNWSTGAMTDSLVATGSGSYWVEVTDTLGCLGSDTILVNLFPVFPLSLGADTTICAGDTLFLDATYPGAAIYDWSTGSGGAVEPVSQAGTVSVQVTDTNGCVVEDTVQIAVLDIPLNLPADTTFCSEDSVLLDAGPVGSSYLWNTGETTQAIQVVSAGVFVVTVTQGVCSESDSTNAIKMPPVMVSLGSDTSLCQGDSLLLDGSIPGGQNYMWSTGATTPSISVNATGAYWVWSTDTNGCSGSDTIQVDFLQVIDNLPSDTAFCQGDSVLLDAGNSGAGYAWSTGSVSQTTTVAAGGQYQVTITLAGCTVSDSVLVTENVPVQVNLGPDTTLCNVDSLLLDATTGGASGYLWSTAATSPSITVTSDGMYGVQVTDTNGCATSDSIQVGFITLSENMPMDTSFCFGDTIQLDAGNPGATYQWNTGDSTQVISVFTGGWYRVTVTSGVCSQMESVEVMVDSLPSVDLGNDTTVCHTGPLVLDAGTPGGVQYAWSTGAVGQTLPASTSGSYAVTVTDTNGCAGADSIQVSFIVLSANLPADTAFCAGDSVLLDAGNAGANYLWSTGATGQTVVAASGGSYSVEIDSGGCVLNDTVNVQEIPLPVVNLGGDTVLCDQASWVLDAGNPGSGYLWSTGDTTQSISINQNGGYAVTVTNTGGCPAEDSIEVTFFNNSSQFPTNPSICPGDSLQLDAGNPGATYVWSTGATSQTIWVLDSGTYAVATSLGLCYFEDSVFVSLNPAPQVNLGPDATLCEGDSIMLQANGVGWSHLWQNGSTAPSLLALSSGTYWVEVTDSLGCRGSDTVVLTFRQAPLVSVLGLDPAYCLGDPVDTLQGLPAGGVWSGAVSSNLFDPLVAGVGSPTVVYSVTDSFGCVGSWVETTVVNDLPTQADAGPDLSQTGDLPLQLGGNTPLNGSGTWTAPMGNVQFSNPGDPTTSATFPGPGTYELVWTISNGVCPDFSDTVLVDIGELLIPSGFSPNGDGRNDTFVVRGLMDFEKRSILIFNRWGNEVFRNEAYNNDWDGDELVDDTYYYILDLGAGGQHAGYVVLKR